MKITSATVLSIAALAAAAPTDYTPKDGWDSIDWNKIDYPKGTGADAVPASGWDSVDYQTSDTTITTPSTSSCPPSPFKFTSTYHVLATPDQVVNGTTPTGGLPGCTGVYDFAFDSVSNTVCYNIVLTNFSGTYQSPALTATHIHQAVKGASGSPRIAFPNPAGDGHERVSRGCLTGPFKTGVMVQGKDSGDGFHVGMIEKDPAGFFADVHSSLAVPGAVRGQLA